MPDAAPRVLDPAEYSPDLVKQPLVPSHTMTASAVFLQYLSQIPSQQGRTAIVTGCNTGVGYWAAFALASKGARVVMACRSMEKAEAARKSMVDGLRARGVDSPQVECMHLDLTSLASVREFASSFRAGASSLDLLLNNAAVMAVKPACTADGWDVQLQVNHLGHFLLTSELMPLLLATKNSRVVNHSSSAYLAGFFDKANPNRGGVRYKFYPMLPATWRRYAQSKLCSLLFTNELTARLAAKGIATVASTAAHPGFSLTQLQQVAAGASEGVMRFVFRGWENSLERGLAQTAADGSTPLLMAATAELPSGTYCGPKDYSKGPPVLWETRGYSHDAAQAADLWAFSCKACGLESFAGGALD